MSATMYWNFKTVVIWTGFVQLSLDSFYCLILRFIKGFIYRHKERCPENEYFLDYVRYSFLMTLRRNLPKNVLDKSWPTPPAALTEVLLNPSLSLQLSTALY